MGLNLIADVALDGAIGRDNDLLWHLSADLKFFKATTMGHPVIMGRRTYESIGRPLPGRMNIVVTHSAEHAFPEGVFVAHSLEEAISMASAADSELFVIGGGQIYSQAIPLASTLYITRVYTTAPDAGAFFPEISDSTWTLAEASELQHDEKEGLDYRFERYTRI